VFTVHRLTEIAELIETGTPLYVRYSPGPEADAAHPSTDHESGLLMPGVSANSLEPPRWWTRPVTDWLARRICQYLREVHEGARPWLLTGREIDFGPDNEPLLTDIHPIAWIAPELLDEAREHYRARFNAGQSTH